MGTHTRWLALPVAAVVALVAWSGSAFAYGKAESPLAQIEFSGNCNNPSFPFCAQPPAGVGLGGIWFWIEIDAGGEGDISGAGCGHTFGGAHGPGGAGGGPIKGEITWSYSNRADGVSAGALSFPGLEDPNDHYYLVTLPGGANKFLFPTTTGHYSFAPVHGVTLQLQVAP
jgi:hypothetical protein